MGAYGSWMMDEGGDNATQIHVVGTLRFWLKLFVTTLFPNKCSLCILYRTIPTYPNPKSHKKQKTSNTGVCLLIEERAWLVVDGVSSFLLLLLERRVASLVQP